MCIRDRLEPESKVELPNVFTPNGDFINDLWSPILENVYWVDVQVFNRWGEVVHSFSGAQNDYSGWDGTNNNTGKRCSQGTYYAVIRAQDEQGEIIEDSGSIYLGL